MIETGTRRGFLVGALALMTTPVIVRADSLMKITPTSVILPEHKFDTRVLINYEIVNDSLIMRVDRKLGRLVRPIGVREVSIEEAKKVFGANHPIFDAQPVLGGQQYAMTSIPVVAHGSGYVCAFSKPQDNLVLTSPYGGQS